ncbi:MAG: polysaccharide lyase beta-sandwich domain-containing protein [Bacteroidales bacterium]|jgi:chondroitin AC lyase|nr:polysaccharide lyase beta-sandwich domain-containing protein [Bacteroidales bacterium]
MNRITFIFALLIASPATRSYASPSPDIEIIRGRIVAALMAPPVNDARVKELMSTLRRDGTWPGIDYDNVSREAFGHSQHLSNMVQMSRAYGKKGSALKGGKELKNAVYLALDYWLAHDFICENWWWNEIGTPDALTSVLLIMDKDLSQTQIDKASAITARSHINAQGARQSGDRIKIAGIQAKNALFRRDAATFEMLVKVIEGEIRFVPADQRGMQYDYSFHHRDDHVNNTLSYGLGYADAFAEWAAYTEGARCRFSEQAVRQLVDYYLDGICKQMVYGKYPDPAAANRDIARQGHGGPMGIRTPERLIAATSYRKAELQEIVNIRQNKAKPTYSFGKFFWLSEYYTHQRPGYFASVRMYSDRNANMEQPYNGEGLMNHHRGDGANYISVTGTEYADVAPVYDWQKIPGTTILQKPSLPHENEIQKYGAMDFAGAVTDGLYGAAAFDFISPHDPLCARKAWFFFDSEYVCLGAGIKSGTNNTVATTMNQCLLHGDVTVNADGEVQTVPRGERQIDDVRWIYHGGAGYIFPQPARINLANQAATGSWFRVNRQTGASKREVSTDIFKLWIDHGARLNGAAYQYVVMPGAGEEQVAEAWQNPKIDVLSNTRELQAVWHKTLKILQIVCYKNSTLRLSGGYAVMMDSPGMVMVKVAGSGFELSVADPSRKLGKMHFSVNRKIEKKGENFTAVWDEAGSMSHISVDLPQAGHAGESVTVKF